MKNIKCTFFYIMAAAAFFTSCSTLEKASSHGLTRGYYKLEYENEVSRVYVEVSNEKLDVYSTPVNSLKKDCFLSIPLESTDSTSLVSLKFRKQGLDLDIASVPLKYRPSVHDVPQQLTADINFALYAGWRYDNFKVASGVDPLGKHHRKITNTGYDFGFFAGLGATPISAFTTDNKSDKEYSGMIIQTGMAGFLESNLASFGVAVGLDYLLSPDRKIWIYNKRPWVGFIVGIAID
jgi:hypothetical protein